MNLRSHEANYDFGNWKNSKEMFNENNLFKNNFDYRSLIFDYKPRYINLWRHNIETFGGVKFNNSMSKTEYFNKFLLNRDNLYYVRHTAVKNDKINLNALKIANIKYILKSSDDISYNLNEKENLKKVGEILKNNNNILLNFLFTYLKFDKKKYYVFEVDNYWDKIFVPKNVNYYNEDAQDKLYFESLSKLKKHNILMKKMKLKNLSNLNQFKILDKKYNQHSYKIKTNNINGAIVLNIEPSNRFKFFAIKKKIKLNIIRVNSIHSLIEVPEVCNNLEILFN